jgi:hypothetical protein
MRPPNGRVLRFLAIAGAVAVAIAVYARHERSGNVEVSQVARVFRHNGLTMVKLRMSHSAMLLRPHAAEDPLSLRVQVLDSHTAAVRLARADFRPEGGGLTPRSIPRIVVARNAVVEYNPNAPGASLVASAIHDLAD